MFMATIHQFPRIHLRLRKSGLAIQHFNRKASDLTLR